ncbi:hypothetical protein CSB45_15590 [candidate division KSB3 bacterium]|uniref:ABC3 transporter permease C-terminal domain-containing protein n=1 Tax=candidate division KSB3 bacterium TaxID=2044937 RepID=A0A2G6E0D8_9BACT|nr:MAG: hypothetical protein CSB45_15590 [candidate division KSB3 bacterium]
MGAKLRYAHALSKSSLKWGLRLIAIFLCIGMCSLSVMLAYLNGLQKNVRRDLADNQGFHLYISLEDLAASGGNSKNPYTQLMETLQPLVDEGQIRSIVAYKDSMGLYVATASETQAAAQKPVLYRRLYPATSRLEALKEQLIVIKDAEADAKDYTRAAAGDGGVYLPLELYSSLLNDQATIKIASQSLGLEDLNIKEAGIYQSFGIATPIIYAVLPKAEDVAYLGMRVDDFFAVKALKTHMVSLGIPAAAISTWQDKHRAVLRALVLEKSLALILVIAVLLMGLMGLSHAVDRLVQEKQREFRILCTLGVPKRRIGAVMLLLVGLLGAISAGMGVLFAMLFVKYLGVKLIPALVFIPYEIQSIEVLMSIGFCIAATLIFGALGMRGSLQKIGDKESYKGDHDEY